MPEGIRRAAGLPVGQRSGAAATYDAQAHTVQLVIATETPVRMPGWQLGLDVTYYLEILDCSPAAVDFSQVRAGNCPLLDAHSRWSMVDRLGAITDGRCENGEVVLTAAFAQTDAARAVEAEVAGPNPPPTSAGYRRNQAQFERFDGEIPVYRITSWTLCEGSFVPIAADANAGVRSADDQSHPCIITETRAMPPEATPAADAATAQPAAAPAAAAPAAAPAARTEPVAEATRAAPAAAPAPGVATPAPGLAARFSATEAVDFLDQARSLGVEEAARGLVQQNEAGQIGVEAARSSILQAAAERQRGQTAGMPHGGAARAGDPNEGSRNAIVEALTARALGRAPADNSGAGEFIGMRLLEIAAVRAGVSPRERDALIILRAANTSSDFPLILEAAANKVLLDRYQLAQPTYRAIAKQRNLRDFKQTKLLRIGDFPTLMPYQEDGEIKAGTINEGRETVQLGSYGRILRLSRQAIVNDDLGAFDDVFGSIGTVVALFENALFYTMKTQNSGNGPKLSDGVNLFNASHGNLAGSGAAPDITTLGAARAAMRKQKNIDGNVMNLTPKVFLVGPDVETVAEQLTTSIQPIVNNAVNPFSGKLTVVSDGNIAGNAWELYADPAVAPVFNYGYLDSAPGPRVISEETFSVDGMAFRVTEDFYVGAVDFKGGYRNPGA